MKKIICAFMAAVMACSVLGGCGKKEEEHGHNMLEDFNDYGDIDSDEMPYGANVAELSSEFDENIDIMICYDVRYYAPEDENGKNDFSEVYKLHDYVKSINSGDAKLMEGLYYPGFLEHVCKSGGYESSADYVEYYHNVMCQRLGEDFDIDYINISNCYSEGDDLADNYFAMIDSELEDFDSSLRDRITSRKVAEIGGYTNYKTSEGSYLLVNHSDPLYVAVYEIDGEYYLF